MVVLSDDDDADCVEHVWRFEGATLAGEGATADYVCERCGAVSMTGPGKV